MLLNIPRVAKSASDQMNIQSEVNLIDFPNGIHCVTTAGTLRGGIYHLFFYSNEKERYHL